MAAAPTIAIEDPDQPELHALLEEADDFYAGLYPPKRNHLLDVAELKEPGVALYVVRAEGRAVGCGAFVSHGGWGEIKRMYVAHAARGQRLGRLVLAALEAHAKEAGIAVIRLETGTKQLPALSLYRSAGYRPRGPFGGYPADRTNVFMEKPL